MKGGTVDSQNVHRDEKPELHEESVVHIESQGQGLDNSSGSIALKGGEADALGRPSQLAQRN